MSGQISFLFDTNKCTGCNACRVACQIANGTGPNTARRMVSAQEIGTFPEVSRINLSLACNHCERPACMRACPTGAIRKRSSDGVVHVDIKLCNGCERCSGACPYGAPRKTPARDRVEKCDFCRERLDRGESPACVDTCPAGALRYGKLNEHAASAGRPLHRSVTGFPDPEITKPATRFLLRPERPGNQGPPGHPQSLTKQHEKK